MNSVSISGRLAGEPELRRTQAGTAVCSFCVAVDRPGSKDNVDFIDCVAWEKRGEFVSKYFRKGDPIEVCGVLTTRSYEERDDRKVLRKRKVTEVKCNEVSFVKQKKVRDDDGQGVEGFAELEGKDGTLPF